MFLYYFELYLINIGWIRIRMDPELLPGSGFRINHSGSTTLEKTTVPVPVCISRIQIITNYGLSRTDRVQNRNTVDFNEIPHFLIVDERLIANMLTTGTFSTLCWWKSNVWRWPDGAIVRIKLKDDKTWARRILEINLILKINMDPDTNINLFRKCSSKWWRKL